MVIYPTFLVPFCTWILMGYFRTIPREGRRVRDGGRRHPHADALEDRAADAVPGIICAVLFSFTLCWNESLRADLHLPVGKQDGRVGVTSDLIRGDIYFWGS